ncbi:MAG: SNF2-related protein [Gemmatimonas sp.]
MMSRFGNLFKRSAPSATGWQCVINDTGVEIRRVSESNDAVLTGDVEGFLTQLGDEGYLDIRETGERFFQWPSVFAALESSDYDGLSAALRLPPVTECRPHVSSKGALTDLGFSMSITGWMASSGRLSAPKLVGGVLDFGDHTELLTAAQWRLIGAVKDFAVSEPTAQHEQRNRIAWAKIRLLAKAANAVVDAFLERSVVLAPQRLNIEMRRSEEVGGVVELIPTFDGAPVDWINHFDRYQKVLDRYEIPTQSGVVQVLVDEQVRAVLQEIKGFTARRVAGSRAEAFLANPFAALGEEAHSVLDESQFEEAKEQAGIMYERFSPIVRLNADGKADLGLLIESANSSGLFDSSEHLLDNAQLEQFIRLAETSLASNLQFIAWQGFDLEVQGDTPEHLGILKTALAERVGAELLVTYDEVYDLSNYSTRIEGIGTEKRQYSPYIAKKNEDDGWFPENLHPFIALKDGEAVTGAVEATPERLEEIRDALKQAQQRNETEFTIPSLPEPMSVADASSLLDTFASVAKDVESGTYNPVRDRAKAVKAKRLLLKENIASVEFNEDRTAALGAHPAHLTVPNALASHVQLLPHQELGVAWLQHLYRLRDDQRARGAVLADDMGLGKTLQLLTFMAGLLEVGADILPMLVVAPVALLENWEEEARKFFKPGSMPILTAYGDRMSELRVPKQLIAERLRTEDGLDKFLKPNWVGDARIVLTTYETLRDYEFGFAKQKWSVIVCDEAQKIKNPAAMVTRAAKKQHAQFKIACTGTPVENALVDLWCLFDFVQPGLLGALNEFGTTYSKPIEAKTDEQRARVEELRSRIAPQILRRTKAEVANDLPAKHIVASCRSLPLSSNQRVLYSKALEDFKLRKKPGTTVPFKNHLGLLQYLRAICTDPQKYGQTVFQPELISSYRAKAPKLDWLLRELRGIQAKGEKVIVFCEFREIQRLLQHYIREDLSVSVDIINGDTSASLSNAASRQKRIKAFQDKPGFGVIILSPLAVGFGVNIQAANHVVHYTRTWNPAKEDQATDRAYRIGQKKDVFVYYPTVTAPDFTTFEAKLDSLLTRKRELASDMLNGAGDVSFEDFRLDDIATNASTRGLDERIGLDAAQRMAGRYFEALTASLWTAMGYQCQLTSRTGDKGVDVIALKGSEGVLLQAKTSGAESARMNWEAVKDVVTGAAFYQRQYSSVKFERACITNRSFNSGAHQQAELNGVRLYDEAELQELLERFPIMESDVERWININ